MAIDFTTDVGKVRALTGDTYEVLPNGQPGLFMSDEELTAIIGMESGLKLAAATALEVMATKHASIMQKIRTLDLQTDGPAVARALLERAKQIREEVATAELEAGDGFEIIEMMFNDQQRADYLWSQWLKNV